MKSDLYSWIYGNNSDWIELTFNYSPIEKKTFNITENEILEIAKEIRLKARKQADKEFKKAFGDN